ncbi:hypothetical protein CFOL_v3_05428, partial [Cephalotus follicularis]
LSTVYASCDINQRKLLWHDLSIFDSGPLPWLIGGDFNTISKPSEKCGGRPYSNKSIDHFNSFIASSSLFEVSYLGDQYTWSFSNLKVVHRPRILSDHCPIVAINHEPTRFPRNFKFLRQWTQDEDFSNVMTRSWALNTEGPPLVTLHKKLLRCKSAFSSFQKQKKEDLHNQILGASLQIQHLEVKLQSAFDKDSLCDLNSAKQLLTSLLTKEEGMLRDKARVKWLSEGDRNT